jgi:hypothetical protein
MFEVQRQHELYYVYSFGDFLFPSFYDIIGTVLLWLPHLVFAGMMRMGWEIWGPAYSIDKKIFTILLFMWFTTEKAGKSTEPYRTCMSGRTTWMGEKFNFTSNQWWGVGGGGVLRKKLWTMRRTVVNMKVSFVPFWAETGNRANRPRVWAYGPERG